MREHLRAIAHAENELRKLGVLRSRNLVGDVAEWIACEELGLSRAPASCKGYDATDDEGRRVQIKGVRRPNRQPGALRELDRDPFDRLVVVVLSADMQEHSIVDMPREEALRRASYQSHTNAWRLTI